MEYQEEKVIIAREEILTPWRQARATLTVRRVETTRVLKSRYVNNRHNDEFSFCVQITSEDNETTFGEPF